MGLISCKKNSLHFLGHDCFWVAETTLVATCFLIVALFLLLYLTSLGVADGILQLLSYGSRRVHHRLLWLELRRHYLRVLKPRKVQIHEHRGDFPVFKGLIQSSLTHRRLFFLIEQRRSRDRFDHTLLFVGSPNMICSRPTHVLCSRDRAMDCL